MDIRILPLAAFFGLLAHTLRCQASLRRGGVAVSAHPFGEHGCTKIAGFQTPKTNRKGSSAEECTQHPYHAFR